MHRVTFRTPAIVGGIAICACCLSAAHGGSASPSGQASSSTTDRAGPLDALLHRRITIDVTDAPLDSVLDLIREEIGAEMVVRFASERQPGLDAATPVSVHAVDQPAVRVLERVLGMVDEAEPATWQVRDGFIEVGAKSRLDQARETRCYLVRDLLLGPTTFDNAPEFDLQSAIQQGNTGGGGGGASGGGGGLGGGGFGGGGGGAGGGGGGGGIFGPPGEEPERMPELSRAEKLREIVIESVESDRWIDNGGAAASIRYHQGVFIVVAPDYIHRQIAGHGRDAGLLARR